MSQAEILRRTRAQWPGKIEIRNRILRAEPSAETYRVSPVKRGPGGGSAGAVKATAGHPAFCLLCRRGQGRSPAGREIPQRGMKPIPKPAGGSGDPPLQHLRQNTAGRDNGRGKPLPLRDGGEIFCGGEPAGGPVSRPTEQFRSCVIWRPPIFRTVSISRRQQGPQPSTAARVQQLRDIPHQTAGPGDIRPLHRPEARPNGGLGHLFPKIPGVPASCTPGPRRRPSSVWAELGELCFLRSRKKSSAPAGGAAGQQGGGQTIIRPDSRAGVQLSTSSSRAAAVPNQQYRSFR